MTNNLRLMKTAVVLVLILPGATLALAQNQQPTGVQKGAIGQMPAAVQQVPVVKTGPVSRPGIWGGVFAPQGVISVELTEKECTNLGGTVNDTKQCGSGKGCVTANKDGTIHAVCIDNK